MLGRYIRVRVTHPVHAQNKQQGYEYLCNYGTVEGIRRFDTNAAGAFIVGIHHPVRNFDGRVIAIIRRAGEPLPILVAAPKSKRYIDNEIREELRFAFGDEDYALECLYESSCGAIVYRFIGGEARFLLIKNRRSAHWSFPKGHVEPGESEEETAKREVFEEAGIHIEILPDFTSKSDYTIQGKVEKSVTIFLAKTADTNTVIQREEIEDYVWLSFSRAMESLRFENDKAILRRARAYMTEKQIIPADGWEGGNHD